MAINALDYYWDPETWIFPQSPLIHLALEGVLEQQILAILICLEWMGTMWWPQLVKLRAEMAPTHLSAAAYFLRFPKGSIEELPKMDPLFLLNEQVI